LTSRSFGRQLSRSRCVRNLGSWRAPPRCLVS